MINNLNYDLKSFPKYLRRSTYLHVLILLLTIVGGKVVIEQKKKLQEKNIQLVEASVRVDIVAMPKFTINELKNVSSGEENVPTEKQEEVKKVEEVKNVEKENSNELALLEEAKKKRENFLSKLKEIGNKKIKNKEKVEKGAGGDRSTTLKDLVLAGNKVSTGVALTGNGSTEGMTEFQVYVAKLPDKVRPHWQLPTFLMNKNLRCRVRIWLDLNGAVMRTEIYQSSGESEYDQRAEQAVRSASPFPKLSEKFSRRAQGGDIVLGFPL